MKQYEKGMITIGSFLNDVYLWLNEPRNRCVEDYHYSCADVMEKRKFKKMIRAFLAQRMYQGENINITTLPGWFLSKAATRYVDHM